MNNNFQENGISEKSNTPDSQVKRRAFLKYSGAGIAASAFIFGACEDVSVAPDESKNAAAAARTQDHNTVYLGSGDVGILNYAYALEQLEAAFYSTVVASSAFGSAFSNEEQMILKDVEKHEIIHREFFKAALGESAIRGLTPDFSAVDFSKRDSVLGTAKAFEDLGVSAYNGAGRLLKDVNYLLVAGKIVSVEARHAAAIRDLINPLSKDFSGDDVVDPATGLDKAMKPLDVLAAAQSFIKEKIDGSDLPTS